MILSVRNGPSRLHLSAETWAVFRKRIKFPQIPLDDSRYNEYIVFVPGKLQARIKADPALSRGSEGKKRFSNVMRANSGGYRASSSRNFLKAFDLSPAQYNVLRILHVEPNPGGSHLFPDRRATADSRPGHNTVAGPYGIARMDRAGAQQGRPARGGSPGFRKRGCNWLTESIGQSKQ